MKYAIYDEKRGGAIMGEDGGLKWTSNLWEAEMVKNSNPDYVLIDAEEFIKGNKVLV